MEVAIQQSDTRPQSDNLTTGIMVSVPSSDSSDNTCGLPKHHELRLHPRSVKVCGIVVDISDNTKMGFDAIGTQVMGEKMKQ